MKISPFPVICRTAFALGLLGGMSGCMADGRPNVAPGTTTAQLQATFGPPLRIEGDGNGGQKWYYETQVGEWLYHHDMYGQIVYSNNGQPSREWWEYKEEEPIAVSNDGKVTEWSSGRVEPNR